MTDATRDAVAANPGVCLAGYRFVDTGGANIPVPATLRDQTVLLCDRQPMAFVCLVSRPDGMPGVRILHRFMRCPVVTTKLKQMALSFSFTGIGPDDLALGLSPFLVTYAGAKY